MLLSVKYRRSCLYLRSCYVADKTVLTNVFFSIFPQGKTVTLKLKNVNFEVKTRALTLPYPVATVDEIFTVAKALLKTERDNESPQPLRLRLMGN